MDFRTMIFDNESSIIRDITKVLTDKNMTVRHPDGAVAEYVQHNKSFEAGTKH
jgi:hypothetical protein